MRAYELMQGDVTQFGVVVSVVCLDRHNARFNVTFSNDGEEVKKKFKRSEEIKAA